MSSRRFGLVAISVFFLFMAAPGAATAESDRVRIWMKAFIPNVHAANPDLIMPVPGRSGRWMIHGPKVLGLELLGSDVCFMTDHRGFDSNPNATAKVTTDFTIIFDGKSATIEPREREEAHQPGLSRKVFCSSGDPADEPRKASFSRPGGVRARGNPAVGDGVVQTIPGRFIW